MELLHFAGGLVLLIVGAVLGMSAIVAPEAITISDQALRVDIPIMAAVAVACLPIFFYGPRHIPLGGRPLSRILPGIYLLFDPGCHPQ